MNKTILGAVALASSVSSLCAQWVQVTPITSPSARAAAAMATGPTGSLLMFGGDTGGFSPSNQSWSYNGSTWTQLTPSTSPSGRAGAEMVFDSNAGVFWMYGGLNSSFFGGASKDETWQFDGTTWTQVFPVTTPGGLGLHGMSFDSVNNVTVVYGGLPDNFFPIDSNQTWEFNGTNWALVTTTGSPGPLERPAMCFHTGIGKTVLFGGIDVQGAWNNNTWTYDANTNTWAVVTIPGAKPGARTGAKMAYDSVRGVSVLTGGSDPSDPNGNTYWNDTWEFDGTTWTQVATNVTGGRLNHMMSFLPTTNRMVLFGGVNFSSFSYYGTTWEWETGTFGYGCAGTNGTPRLSVNSSPRLGQSWTVTASNLNPSINLAVLAFGFTPLPGIDLGPIVGMPGCLAYTTPDLLITISGAAGAASWTWPTVTGTAGDSWRGQALCLDPTVNAFGFTISNAISATVGN